MRNLRRKVSSQLEVATINFALTRRITIPCLQFRSRTAFSNALAFPRKLGSVRLSRLRCIVPEKVPAGESRQVARPCASRVLSVRTRVPAEANAGGSHASAHGRTARLLKLWRRIQNKVRADGSSKNCSQYSATSARQERLSHGNEHQPEPRGESNGTELAGPGDGGAALPQAGAPAIRNHSNDPGAAAANAKLSNHHDGASGKSIDGA